MPAFLGENPDVNSSVERASRLLFVAAGNVVSTLPGDSSGLSPHGQGMPRGHGPGTLPQVEVERTPVPNCASFLVKRVSV